VDNQDLIYRLRKRAEIRRQINTRKSVQEGAPDRIADLLEEAADALESMPTTVTRTTGVSGAALICRLDNTNSMRTGHESVG